VREIHYQAGEQVLEGTELITLAQGVQDKTETTLNLHETTIDLRK
jgi:hypothetical protein